MDEFEVYVAKFERLVYTVCYRIIGNEEDAKDATQDVFIKFYQIYIKNNDIWENENALKGWLCKVATNKSVDLLRKNKSGISSKIVSMIDKNDTTNDIEIKDSSPTPEQAFLEKESMDTLQAAINTLSEKYKVVIVLRDMQGYSYEEVAKMTNTSLGTVKSRVHRAREQLKKILKY